VVALVAVARIAVALAQPVLQVKVMLVALVALQAAAAAAVLVQ
jgi:hypothetical protein